MRHLLLEEWSRREGPLHRRDPRAKTAAALVFLVLVAVTHNHLPQLAAAWIVSLALLVRWAQLPVFALLARAGLVLPFSIVFAGATWAAGDGGRALSLLLKSYVSAAAVLVVVATTPMPQLLRGLELSGVPRFLLMVTQFLYRYLFVIAEEARNMRTAAAARGGSFRGVLARSRFRAAAGALAVLFARSHQRAEEIHRAMLARGFDGRFRPLQAPRFRAADAWFLLLTGGAPIALRAGLEGILR